MYQAELHGKVSRAIAEAEDVLTSNVFSFYLYSERVHLQRLLKSVDIEVSLREAEDADFSFWPTFKDRTEPDLVLRVGRYYVLIEAKLHSGYGKSDEGREKHQLLWETRAGREEAEASSRDFILLTVTDEPVPDQSVYGVLQGRDRTSWRWTNWSRIADLLETSPPVCRMGQDLVALLWRKGLRRFDGFTGTEELIRPYDGFWFFDATTAQFGRFSGFTRLLPRLPLIHLPIPLFLSESATLKPPLRRGRCPERAKP